MRAVISWIAMLIAAGGISACAQSGVFPCTMDPQCQKGGVQGQCQQGYCAFPDTTCSSGFKWDTTAGNNLSGQCVPPKTTVDSGTMPDLGTGSDGGTPMPTVCAFDNDNFDDGCVFAP